MPEQTQQGIEAKLDLVGSLDAVLIKKDGTRIDYGCVSSPKKYRLIGRPVQWWRSLWTHLKMRGIIPNSMGFAVFLATYGVVERLDLMQNLFSNQRVMDVIFGRMMGLVVTGGMNFLAADMASTQTTPRIGSMNFHDMGTGSTAATSTDSGLQTPGGCTRASGTRSNPATNQYRTIGTVNFPSSLTIQEWGLFDQSTSGTMWDRRVFTGIGGGTGDSIQFTYTLTLTAGGT